MKRKTTLYENELIWFGAAVSLAEIQAGGAFAPLDFKKAVAALLCGHLIGCVLLFLAGVVGGLCRKSAMETVKSSFGAGGGLLFAALNVLQLTGWTAIMLYDGAVAANAICPIGSWIWCLCIGLLLIIWIFVGISRLKALNTVAMAALLMITLVLCKLIFFNQAVDLTAAAGETLSFGAAVELAAAMPLSWLPLIADYTREAEKPVSASAVSAVTYGLVSCWMYSIGLGATLLTAEADVAQIMLKVGLGGFGLMIVILSTVTTTFLDACSAGISAHSLLPRIAEKRAAAIVTVLGTVMAVFCPVYDISEFLYIIGSVFAPMSAVVLTDFFCLHRQSDEDKAVLPNLLIWLAGFILYRVLMHFDLPLGYTLPDVLLTACLCVAYRFLFQKSEKA